MVSRKSVTFAWMKQLLTVIAILLALSCCTTEADRTRMRAGLDSINQCNRTGQPFTVRQVEPYVRFFDSHGTPNDRLLAHYLLGRAYHEHGEAPMALQCYHDAIDCADTTAADCNFAQLARVYGQMSGILYDQCLFEAQLTYIRKSIKWAWYAKDTLSALMMTEQLSLYYKNENQADSAVAIIEDVAQQYIKYGYDAQGAIALGSIVNTLLKTGNYSKAQKYMSIVESESGLFDNDGNVESGHELYYNFKGLLALYSFHLDSAEYWFRKELKEGKDFNNQGNGAYGLAITLDQLHHSDSAAKYYRYAYEMNDSLYAQMTTNEIERMQAMYDYSHQQKLAMKESQRADRLLRLLETGIASAIAFALLAYIIIHHLNRKRKDAISKYKNSIILIEQAQYDIAKLRSQEEGSQSMISQKEEMINTLQKELIKFQQKKIAINHDQTERLIKESSEYKTFLKMSTKGQVPSDTEWQKLHVVIFELLPDFQQLLVSKQHLLNKNEFNACFLVRLHFKPLDLMNMLNVLSSYANKIRKSLLQKLFDIEGKAEEFDERITSVF